MGMSENWLELAISRLPRDGGNAAQKQTFSSYALIKSKQFA